MVLACPKDNKALKSSQSDISLLSKNIGRKEKQIDCETMISNNLFNDITGSIPCGCIECIIIDPVISSYHLLPKGEVSPIHTP